MAAMNKVNIVCFQTAQYTLIPSISGNGEPSAPVSKRKKRKTTASSLPSPTKPQKKRIDRRKTVPKTSGHPSIPRRKALITSTQKIPLVVGRIYMKVENFDLEELSVNFCFNFHSFESR
jgi:hypothetical protein